MLDFVRIGCAVPRVRIADPKTNAKAICDAIAQAQSRDCDLLIFPELSLTGCTCGDLFFQKQLLDAAWEGVLTVAKATVGGSLTAVVGAPVVILGRTYDCAVILSGGEVRGIVPKALCTAGEARWFASGVYCPETLQQIPAGPDLRFVLADGTRFAVAVGDDLTKPISQSARLCSQGAEIVVNLAANPHYAGAAAHHQALACQASNGCVYACVSAGSSESTQDLVYSGQCLVAQDGKRLAGNEKLPAEEGLLVVDADLGALRHARRQDTVCFPTEDAVWLIECEGKIRADGSLYPITRNPFLPEDPEARNRFVLEAFDVQVTGLQQRLKLLNTNAVIGISGGLDSTLAVLVAVEAMHRLGRPASDVYAVTMPSYGTSGRTYNNAWALMADLGVTIKEIPIKQAIDLHFADIGHDPKVFNGTYENAQARERTQILMDYASVVGGIVIGTGDLSELALGWCTYNGDHMSMYGVNGSIPKTMIPWIIRAVSDDPRYTAAKAVLEDILDTPISPELLPPDESGNISQHTEDLVGPYALHDFFLYRILCAGDTPKKVYALACRAFAGQFTAGTVKKWLKGFYRRFFTQQFKRSCMPEGVKAINLSLSPRGDWNMPSDATARIWLEEAENL